MIVLEVEECSSTMATTTTTIGAGTFLIHLMGSLGMPNRMTRLTPPIRKISGLAFMRLCGISASSPSGSLATGFTP